MPRLRLHEICGYRAGDKGDIANIALFADDAGGLRRHRPRGHGRACPRALRHDGDRGRACATKSPNVLALNFVLRGALGGGGPRSLRSDALGKTLGGALVRLEIDVPDDARWPARAAPRRRRGPWRSSSDCPRG